MLELRCEHKQHGLLLEDGRLEIKCSSRFCGAQPGVVVLHRFDLHTGAVETVRYKEPHMKGQANGAGDNRPAIRLAGRSGDAG